jgi:hypothetical protein
LPASCASSNIRRLEAIAPSDAPSFDEVSICQFVQSAIKNAFERLNCSAAVFQPAITPLPEKSGAEVTAIQTLREDRAWANRAERLDWRRLTAAFKRRRTCLPDTILLLQFC